MPYPPKSLEPQQGSRGGNAPQGSAGTPSQEALRRPKGRRNDPAIGKRTRNGSGDSSLHVFVPDSEVDYFAVNVKLTAGAPTVRATISGTHTVFIADTGSSISLIQPGVYSSEVRPTNLSPFGVTGIELDAQGIQDVQFYLKDRKFRHEFYVRSLPTEVDGILGMDFLSERNTDLNLDKLELRWSTDSNFKHSFVSQGTRQARRKAGHVALTVLTTQNGHHSRERISKVARGEGMRTQEREQCPQQFDLKEADAWIVKTTETDWPPG
jgi:hypothetical protein